MPFPVAPTFGSGVQHYGGTTSPPPSGVKTRSIPFDKEIIHWERDLYPTSSIVMMENSITKSSPQWIRWEKKPFPHWATADSAIAAATTDFTTGLATHLTRITRYDAWLVEDTGELLLMNGAAATPYDAVQRGVGSVPAAIIPAGGKLVKIGSAFPTGAVAPTAHYVLEDEITFYGTEHMVSVESDSHILVTKFPAEANRHAAEREARRIEFTEMIKRSYFGSRQAAVTSTTGHQLTVKGLEDHVATWTYNFAGILTKPDFFGFVGDGPGRYIKGDIGIACGSFIHGIVNNWLGDIAQADQDKDIDTLGFNVKNLKLVAGRRAKLFYEAWLDESPVMQGKFYVFPLNKKQGSRHVTCSGPELDGKVQLKKNIKTEDGYTGRKDVWYAFYGWDHGPEIGYGIGSGIEG